MVIVISVYYLCCFVLGLHCAAKYLHVVSNCCLHC